MKTSVEERLLKTLEYIKAYNKENGVCPTYREIMGACSYASLSLLSKDIRTLVDRKELFINAHKKIQVVDSIKTTNGHYEFPLLFASNAVLKEDELCEEDKELLSIQYMYLRGEYLEANEKANELIKKTQNLNIRFGCLLTKCCCALYTGNPSAWRETFMVLIGFEPKSKTAVMAKELSLYFLSTVLRSKINCPKWLKEGRFYGLSEKALPLAKLTYVGMVVTGDKPLPPQYLEPFCSEAQIEGIELCQVYMDLYLAMSYHYQANDEYLNVHLNEAVKTCIKNKWLTPLVEMKKPLGTALERILMDVDESTLKKINALEKTLCEGFVKIYSAIVGDDPTTRLTLREAEIANYVRQGLSNKEIAAKLYLSPETIKYYLSSIYSKTNVSDRKALKALFEQVE